MKYSNFFNHWYLFRGQAALAFKSVFDRRQSWIFLFINLFFVIAIFVGSLEIFLNFREEIMVLHYNVDFGVDWIGQKNLVFWLAGVGAFIFFLDFLVVLLISKRRNYDFISLFLFGGLTICEIFLLAAVFSVYLVNFR